VDPTRPLSTLPTMRVSRLWRHPVKSLQGEEMTEAVVDADGIRGDRAWGVRDEATGRILTGRREPRLLLAGARLDGDEPVMELPTGVTCRGPGPATDAALSEWLEAGVSLVKAAAEPPSRAEFYSDATDDTSALVEWTMPSGRFVDALPVLVVTTASLDAGRALYPEGEWDPRRFRPNVLVETDGEPWLEDAWCGRRARIGEVELLPVAPCVRCTMVTRHQPGLDRDTAIYKTLARHHDGTFGVWSAVGATGTIRAGDTIEIIER
jgi:uncharacterized protein YcbX